MTTLTEANVWSITLSPNIREWFGSGKTPVSRLGIVIRSADGSKKGIESDSFVEVTVVAAVNAAQQKVDDTATEEMGKITGGMNIPGLGGTGDKAWQQSWCGA